MVLALYSHTLRHLKGKVVQYFWLQFLSQTYPILNSESFLYFVRTWFQICGDILKIT
jgi:hypothetical protein